MDPHYELGVRDTTIKNLHRKIAAVDQQADDEGFWFEAGTCAEAHLQQALRSLHAAIEDKSPRECAVETLTKSV